MEIGDKEIKYHMIKIITICVKMNIDVNFILTGKEKEEIEKKLILKMKS